MIITGGKDKGRRIKTVNDKIVRPTSSKVRMSIFNMIQSSIEGAKVLDLFAGSGVLGIESISRGAGEAVFVEKDRTVAKFLKENLTNLGINHSLFVTDALNFLKKEQEINFDIIFIDPPYASDLVEKSVELIINRNLLAKNGLITIEYKADRDLSQIVNKFNLMAVKQKKYGDTVISIVQQD